MRLRDWGILALHSLSSAIERPTDDRHLRTDPMCVQHRPPRRGSRLDRASRGISCTPCMAAAAFGDHTCRVFPITPGYLDRFALSADDPTGEAS